MGALAPIVVGFTGTPRGMRGSQRKALLAFLGKHTVTCLHHGQCVGADEEAHQVALFAGVPIHRHPPISARWRADLHEGAESAAKGYHERNHDIVDACDVLLAAPLDPDERSGGGTWSTIHYARKKGKRVVMLP